MHCLILFFILQNVGGDQNCSETATFAKTQQRKKSLNNKSTNDNEINEHKSDKSEFGGDSNHGGSTGSNEDMTGGNDVSASGGIGEGGFSNLVSEDKSASYSEVNNNKRCESYHARQKSYDTIDDIIEEVMEEINEEDENEIRESDIHLGEDDTKDIATNENFEEKDSNTKSGSENADDSKADIPKEDSFDETKSKDKEATTSDCSHSPTGDNSNTDDISLGIDKLLFDEHSTNDNDCSEEIDRKLSAIVEVDEVTFFKILVFAGKKVLKLRHKKDNSKL